MESVQEIQRALEHLPSQQKWQIAQWLLEELQGASTEAMENGKVPITKSNLQPDYAGRRKQIFGDKVVPNLI